VTWTSLTSLWHPCVPRACWTVDKVKHTKMMSTATTQQQSHSCQNGKCCLIKVLGCTAPVVPAETDAIIFVADGRFHLEAIMIANPAVPAFRCGYPCTPLQIQGHG
jgi:diphthamide biosynthesis enzyme Dph1/Dph2-like protein